jgi:5,10-methylenetetrahydrofolate reductase
MIEQLITKLKSDQPYLTLETTPSHLPTIDNIIEKIQKYEFCDKIDGFSATDSPLSKLKYSAIMASIKIQQRFNKPVIATISMRDRNKIALQSDLLGANDFDIRAILALTGDPAKMSDQPNTKAVLEGNSNLLLEIINSFNHGVDYAGKPFAQKPKQIYPFSVTNSYAKNFKTLEKKLVTKIKNGSIATITQPVYDIDNAKELMGMYDSAKSGFSDDRADAQLIFGFFPIVRFRTAQFLSSHVPGIYVPDMWLDKLSYANKIGEDEERKIGLELSINLFNRLKKFHNKIHMMSANNFELADIIINNK